LKDLQVYKLESFINRLLILQLIRKDEMVNLFCFQIGVSWSDLLWTNRECIRVLSSSFSAAERCSGLGVRCLGLGVRCSGVEALRARCIHLLRKQFGDFPPKNWSWFCLKSMSSNENLFKLIYNALITQFLSYFIKFNKVHLFMHLFRVKYNLPVRCYSVECFSFRYLRSRTLQHSDFSVGEMFC
jgi:hypothetical protein